MKGRRTERLLDRLRLIHASARLIGGRRYWITPLLPLVWIAFQIFRLVVRWRPTDYVAADAQNVLIGFPLTVLAIGFGLKIIAAEIDRRTLEIAYTVPGGAHRVWLAKLAAALGLLLVAEALLAIATFVFCTEFPLGALYGALQGAVFYMALAMALAALLKSEAAGALAVVVVLVFNWVLQQGAVRVSPFWNPDAPPLSNLDAAVLLARATQNRIGIALAVAAIVALAFGRAERREKLLSG